MRSFVVAALALVLSAVSAHAIDLDLAGDKFWIVLASRQDLDAAIAMAQRQRDPRTMVVRATNGWYAAISGPHIVRAGTARPYLDGLVKDHRIPKDAYLARGVNFTGVAWTPPATNILDTLAYDGEHDATLHADDLDITLSRQQDGKDQYDPTATATYKGKAAFTIVVPDHAAEKPASQVALVRLDPASGAPQVVFTYFWQGAHCCTITKIATLSTAGTWHVIDGDALDGDGGYGFEDLDKKGWSYLISVDQSFLYAFASYAESLAPTRIHRLVGDKLVDVTAQPQFRHRLLQDLYGDEDGLADAPAAESWHSNGFLAGWVAASLLVDRGEAAWSRMLTTYDHHSDFGPQRCTTEQPLDSCPDDKKVRITFPVALRDFLVEHGYIADPRRFPVPDESGAVPNPAAANDTASALSTCKSATDQLRKLIYRTFAGRETRLDDSADGVELQDDTALEDYDTGTRKATCAVTYVFTLRPLIGRLLRNGKTRRAESLMRLARRDGSTTHRVTYTVQPTQTGGKDDVVLLP